MPVSENICVISCPHCSLYVEVIALNCRIFRCGIIKETMKQIDPHLPKEQCDELVKGDLIFGCGKPFRVDGTIENPEVSICDYI